MARIRHLATGLTVPLTPEHMVGRSSAALLRLRNAGASGMHALLRWTGEDWEIRDLGSRNGTLVDGARLESGQRQVVPVGARLGFGDPSDPWELVEGGAPEAVARDGAGAWAVAVDGLLLLPDAGEPEHCVYADAEGRWVAESGADLVVLGEEPELVAGGRSWRVYPPRRVVPTNAPALGASASLDEVELCFEVSQDEEDVAIELRLPSRVTRIPHHSHHYFLLSLARARADDRRSRELPASEHGWRYQDDLCRQLRIPDTQFNVTIFRARQLLMREGIADAARLIERRRGSGQLRLGTERFAVR